MRHKQQHDAYALQVMPFCLGSQHGEDEEMQLSYADELVECPDHEGFRCKIDLLAFLDRHDMETCYSSDTSEEEQQYDIEEHVERSFKTLQDHIVSLDIAV